MNIHPDILLISTVFVINLGIISLVVYKRIRNKAVNRNLLDTIKQLGSLALGIGVFMQMLGLFSALQGLEGMAETLPLRIIAGGLKASIPSTLHGLGVYFFSLISYVILNLTERSRSDANNQMI